MLPIRMKTVGAALLALLLAPGARSETQFSQGFDDVAGGTAALAAEGWIFRDQSSAAGTFWWTSNFAVDSGIGYFLPMEGAGFLRFGGASNLQATTTVSSWIILPPVSGQVAGDTLSYWQRGAGFAGAAAVELRYSPGGGTSTGSTPTSVGAFTTVLSTDILAEGAPYEHREALVPGPGRLAFRVTGTVPVFGFSPFLALDSLAFNPPPLPFPLPAAGETVTWTAPLSPILIATDVAISAGGTVLVDPGVEVRVAAGKTLFVLGSLEANGTAAAPVRFTGLGAASELAPWIGGTLDLERAVVDLAVHPRTGATIVAANTTFTANGSIVNAFDGILDPARSVLRLDGCVFQGSTIQMDKLLAALRGVDFQQQTMFSDVLLLGYVLLDDVSIDGTALWLGKERGKQPTLVDGVTVRNSQVHGGLYLQRGTDFLLGPSNVLQNNAWPVEFGVGCAGLLPGSVVPRSGNVQNAVADTDDFDPQADVTWAGLDVPYVVRISRFLGEQRILPGATIQFEPYTGWQADPFGFLTARGTEDAPIVFERAVAGMAWGSVELFHPGTPQRLEHCVFRGAERAVVSDDAQIDSCRFEQCAEGLFSGSESWTVVRKCEFVANGIGINAFNPTQFTDGSILCASPTNPNSFTGNGLAVQASQGGLPNAAQHNWWGHPSGPFHPILNPAGQGDPIALAGGTLPFQPVLAAAPDSADSPPHVAWLDGHTLLAEPGTTLLLTFAAADDGSIASQRLLFSTNGNAPGSMSQVQALAASVRTVAFTVPAVGLQVNGQNAFLRIESFDDRGQLGYDELELFIVDPSLAGTLALATDYSGTHRPGDHFEVQFTTSGIDPVIAPAVYGRILLDGDRAAIGIGGETYSSGSLSGGVTLPEVSTDRARIALYLQANLNQQEWVFSEPFAIRPPALLGDAPPIIAVSSPAAGDHYLAGSAVPIRWIASDDEALRSFDVQVSNDGGRHWNVVAQDLSGAATAFDWALPNGLASDDVRVRVIAHDHRFQNSAAGDTVSFRIVQPGNCQQDLGYGSPGGPALSVCGAPLASGHVAALTLAGAPASQPGLLLAATALQPTPFLGGTLATLPLVLALPIATGAGGQFSIGTVPGGGGSAVVYLQAVVAAPADPFGVKLSNAIRLDLLP